MKVLQYAVLIIGGIVLIAALLFLPLYFLWNWLMPTIFGLPEITLLQSIGLLFLSGILFKSGSSSNK